MGKHGIAVIVIIITMGLVTPGVLAKGNKGDKHPSGQGAEKQKDKPRGKAKHENGHDQGWGRDRDFEVRTYHDRDGRPPGWGRGQKTGWGDCGVPPGHAKKGECRTYQYQGRRYYYYRDQQGNIIVRRPAVEIGVP